MIQIEFHRAREYYLYTREGKRFYDFWLDDGKAILGHKPKKLLHMIKNTAEKGLWGQSNAYFRIKGLVSLGAMLFPGWHVQEVVRVPQQPYSGIEKEEEFILAIDATKKTGDIAPDVSLTKENTAVYYFFGAKDRNSLSSKDYLLVMVPFNWSNQYVILFSKKEVSYCKHILTPIEVTGICETLKRINFLQRESNTISSLESLVIPNELWDRHGRYALYKKKDTEYTHIYKMYHSQGIQLSPNTPQVCFPLHISHSMVRCWNRATKLCMT